MKLNNIVEISRRGVLLCCDSKPCPTLVLQAVQAAAATARLLSQHSIADTYHHRDLMVSSYVTSPSVSSGEDSDDYQSVMSASWWSFLTRLLHFVKCLQPLADSSHGVLICCCWQSMLCFQANYLHNMCRRVCLTSLLFK